MLTDRERDAYIAEKLFGKINNQEDEEGFVFSTSCVDAFVMEEKIKEQELDEQYMKWLDEVVMAEDPQSQFDPSSGHYNDVHWFKIAHASPSDRAHACYLMFELSEDTKLEKDATAK